MMALTYMPRDCSKSRFQWFRVVKTAFILEWAHVVDGVTAIEQGTFFFVLLCLGVTVFAFVCGWLRFTLREREGEFKVGTGL